MTHTMHGAKMPPPPPPTDALVAALTGLDLREDFRRIIRRAVLHDIMENGTHWRQTLELAGVLATQPAEPPRGGTLNALIGRLESGATVTLADGLAAAQALRAGQRVRAALAAMVGVDTRAELEEMETQMRAIPAPLEDKAASLDAIHALLATLPEDDNAL